MTQTYHKLATLILIKGEVTKKRKQSILSFLAKRSEAESEGDTQDVMTVSQSSTQTVESNPSPEVSSGTSQKCVAVFSAIGLYDFGTLTEMLANNQLYDEGKYKAISNLDGAQDFNFPFHIEGGQERCFWSSSFKKYPWLTYSWSESGGYCSICNSSGDGKSSLYASTILSKFISTWSLLQRMYDMRPSKEIAVAAVDGNWDHNMI